MWGCFYQRCLHSSNTRKILWPACQRLDISAFSYTVCTNTYLPIRVRFYGNLPYYKKYSMASLLCLTWVSSLSTSAISHQVLEAATQSSPFLNPCLGEHSFPRGSVFVWESSCCKPSDAITVCISGSYTEADPSTKGSHIFQRCRVTPGNGCESVRKIFMGECKLAADVAASTICVAIATKEDAAKFLFPTCFQFLFSFPNFFFLTFLICVFIAIKEDAKISSTRVYIAFGCWTLALTLYFTRYMMYEGLKAFAEDLASHSQNLNFERPFRCLDEPRKNREHCEISDPGKVNQWKQKHFNLCLLLLQV